MAPNGPPKSTPNSNPTAFPDHPHHRIDVIPAIKKSLITIICQDRNHIITVIKVFKEKCR
jgi:hypothetical protein